MKKFCEQCGKSFYTNLNKKRFCNVKCKIKAKEKRKFKILQGKALIFLGGQCKKCGIKDLRVLQFDHKKSVKETKERRLSKNKSFFNKIINKKIINIQLLCANCHQIKTWRE